MSYDMTTSQERHILHQYIVHLYASKSRSWRRWPSKVAQVKRKKRRHAKTPQMMKKSQWTPTSTSKSKRWTNAWRKSTQWVHDLPQRWASPPTYEGWEEVQEEATKEGEEAKHESFAIFGEWVSGGESSANSSDKSNKKFTTRTNIGSSSNTCLMAQDMESDVSDDDSDSPSYNELLDLVHEHQRVIKKIIYKNVVLSLILMLLLPQIMMICCANSNCLARSMKSLI